MRGAFDSSGWRPLHLLVSHDKAEKMQVVMVCERRRQMAEIKYPSFKLLECC